MTRTDSLDLVPADFFVLRTPLLPFDEIARWSADLGAARALDGDAEGADDRLATAVAVDRVTLRRRLDAMLERPELREALLVASPALLEGFTPWRRDPESKKGRRFEEALVRYLQRMTTRSTPFGLFSGCTVGTVGEATTLRLADRSAYRRHTRLDSSYLSGLCEELGRTPELRGSQRYHVNSSLYRIGDRIRYAESHVRGRSRSHHLVSVASDDYLERALAIAAAGATAAELARALVALDPEAEVTSGEAGEFVDDLIETQVLVPEVEPPVTGDAPVDALVEQLRALGACRPAVEMLSAVRARLAALDERPIGTDLAAYSSVASILEELPARIESSRALQVDLMKPGRAALGAALLSEIERGVRILHRLQAGSQRPEIQAFREAFLERHEEGEEVPLVEVLDGELGSGLGLGDGSDGDVAPLLEGLAFPAAAPAARSEAPASGPLFELLVRKLEGALRDDALEIEIAVEELDALPEPPLPIADAFLVKAAISAPAGADLEAEFEAADVEIVLDFVAGPSGAQMLGRFCYADPELEQGVRRHLRREESLDPDALFAEIVHLPEGRLGNVLLRPVLRDHEIQFLGRGGAPEDHRIPVNDLLVSVVGGEVVLRSRRLGRRVVPRLTSAHNYTARSLSVYRFLCSLQSQGSCAGLTWSWGPLGRFSFLPRVRSGRIVLSRARWRVRRDEIEGLHDPEPARRFAAAQRWRTARRLPRFALLADGDNELLVDLENSLSVDAFAATVRRRPGFELVELLPGPERLCASGPEGGFCHEILVPFTRRTSPRPRPHVSLPKARVRRRFEPGSEWLFAKLYTGTATADRVLTEVVWPLSKEAQAAGTVDRWFFLRYSDPHPHLRLRFHGAPEALRHDLLPALEDRVAPLLAGGLAWRLQIEEYRREVERYGGPAGIELAERLFHLDSEAVVEALLALPEDTFADVRWRLALLGTDLLISDLGIDGEGELDFLAKMKEHWAKEFRLDRSPALKKQLADKLRAETPALRSLLFDPVPQEDPLGPAVAALRRRSKRALPVVQQLRLRERAGALTSPLRAIAFGLVHMFNNRLLRSRGRAHELVLSDFLERIHRSEAARSQARRSLSRQAV